MMNTSDIERLQRQIEERENHFHHALCESLDWHILNNLKNDLDFLKEKKKELEQTPDTSRGLYKN